VARPVTGWSPFDLGVHRAITVPDAAGEPLPDLPRYLRRAHDADIDEQLADVSQNVMIVLTGESSTGKTRALYESVLTHRHLREWPLWYPRTADELLELMQSGRLSDEAILWLNESHKYLSGPTGDVAAAALWSLLDGSRAGSTVVLGTLWPQFWAEFVARPRSAQRDEHANARELLQQRTRRVRVAERFGDEDVKAARSLGADDPRLSAALSASGRGREVIQTMAGGPVLVERLKYPDDADDRFAAAIVTAAIDARRLGQLQPLSLELLDAAALGYLEEHDRVDAPEDWFQRGLARAAAEAVLGVTALLPRRRSPGPGPADCYELHDYLDQHGRVARRSHLVPETLWEALLARAEALDDLMRLAKSACHRLLYRYADPFLERAIEMANEDAQDHLIDLMSEYGRIDRATRLLRDTAYGPHPQRRPWAIRSTDQFREVRVLSLIGHGCIREAQALLEAYAERPDVRWAWIHLSGLLTQAGEFDKAVELLQRLIENGPSRHDAIEEHLADLLADRGDWEQVVKIVQTGKAWWAPRWLARRFAAAGRLDRLRALAEVGGTVVSLTLIESLLEHNQIDEALELFTQVRDPGEPSSELLDLLVRHGELDLAINAVVGPGLNPSDDSLRHLADALSAHGHRDRVPPLLRELAEAEPDETVFGSSPDVLADLLADYDCWAEALDIARHNPNWARKWIPRQLAMSGNIVQLRKLLDQGNEHAGREYVKFLVKNKRIPEALELVRTFADAGDDWACEELASCLTESRRFDELISRSAGGDEHASRRLVTLAYLQQLPDSNGLLLLGLTAEGRRHEPNEG
jgi:tetratricopeptide (TPR) repeat protein